MAKEYDVIIIGAGPAGLTAGTYSSRGGLTTLILEKTGLGGQLVTVDTIENYPGFPEGITGFELVEKMKKQAERFGVEFVSGEMSEIITQNSPSSRGHFLKGELGSEGKLKTQNLNYRFYLKTKTGEEYYAKAVIIATGASPKGLGMKGEVELRGKGISYCATCDGPLFKNKEVVVIGGGDAAVGEAIYLTRFAKKVTLAHRRDKLRAAKILQDRILKNDKVEIKWNTVPVEVLGEGRVSGVRLKDVNTAKEFQIPADGVFFFVGIEPNTTFLKGMIGLDKDGFIITDEDMHTSSRGIFACGDVRKKGLRQVVTACGEGAQAAFSCQHFIDENS